MNIDPSRFHPELKSLSIELETDQPLHLARRRAEYSIPHLRWDPEIEIRAAIARSGAQSVGVRLYEPRDRGTSGALLHIHGGGFVLGDLDMDHRRCLNLALGARCLVVSVDYRLAPEHPYPIGFEDCFSALTWLKDNARDLDVDPARIGIIGSSAGASLAAAVAIRARDESGPPLAVQLLVYPMLDSRLETRSIRTFWNGPGFSGKKAAEVWKLYAPQYPESFAEYASPALAQDLSGLPPTYLSVAEFDPLRDEGISFAMRLLDANVAVDLRTFPGTWHGFDLDAPDTTIAEEFREAEVYATRRHLAVSS
jgi:acetyl esterase